MSSNKNVVRKTRTSLSSSIEGKTSTRRKLEKSEKPTDATRKSKTEEAKVSVKNSTRTTATKMASTKTKDVEDNKQTVKSVTASSNTAKRTKPNATTTTTRTKPLHVATPSKRIVKSQYFPSKDMISNVVKSKLQANAQIKGKEPAKKPRDSSLLARKRNVESANGDDSRPRTATLRRASVLNVNLPEVSASSTNEEDVYDDDFDSYESDFEEYRTSSSSSSISDAPSAASRTTSSSSSDLVVTTSAQKAILADEERKLDSGNYDLNVESKHKQLLDNIKESVEQENAALSNLTSLSDEGFEDGKSMNGNGTNGNFINFHDAQKKCIRRKSIAQRRKRGEELLNMIKLNGQNFTLLDIPAVGYDDYIRIYGKRSGHQVSSQTGDDDVSETTQTDVDRTFARWTQFPIVISDVREFKRTNYLMDLNGCGTDAVQTAVDEDLPIDFDDLAKFLASVEDVIVQLLEKTDYDETSLMRSQLPFSDGFVPIGCDDVAVLNGKDVVHVAFSQTDGTRFLTVHNSRDVDATAICVWTTIRPARPEKLLITYGKVTCCCFGLDNHRIIYGAFEEGTIAVWRLDESSELKSRIDEELFIRPNYTTGINYGHVAKIVAVQALIDDHEDVLKGTGFATKSSTQICSVDESGTLIVWSVIMKSDENRQWSVSLTQNSKIVLNEIDANLKDVQCTDMTINLLDQNHVFISTNYGCILHYILNGTKPVPNKYTSDNNPANCLIACPFAASYFLSAQNNGKIVLYSRTIEKRLKELEIVEEDVKILMLQWSYTRPFIFYAIDNENNLYVWNLANSDLYPIHTVKFDDRIRMIRLSPYNYAEDDWNKSFMVIVTDDNKVDLHLLNDEHGRQEKRNYDEDVKKFLNYISRF